MDQLTTGIEHINRAGCVSFKLDIPDVQEIRKWIGVSQSVFAAYEAIQAHGGGHVDLVGQFTE